MNALMSDNDKAKMLQTLGPLIIRLERRKSLRIQYFNQSLTMTTIIHRLSNLVVRYVFRESLSRERELLSINISRIGKSISNEYEKSRWENMKNEILQDPYWKGTIATLIRVWLLCDHCCRSLNAALDIDAFPTGDQTLIRDQHTRETEETDETPNTNELRQSLNNNFSEGLNPHLQDKGFSIEDLYQMLNTIDQIQGKL